MAVLSNSKKINTKYWIVFAVEPFKKRCDNFDAEFRTGITRNTHRHTIRHTHTQNETDTLPIHHIGSTKKKNSTSLIVTSSWGWRLRTVAVMCATVCFTVSVLPEPESPLTITHCACLVPFKQEITSLATQKTWGGASERVHSFW